MYTITHRRPSDRSTWELDSMRRFPDVVAQRHIGGGPVRTQGAMTPKLELGRDFCTAHHLPQVSSSYVYSFGSYRVDKQTHKQTDGAENIQRSSLRYDVAYISENSIL